VPTSVTAALPPALGIADGTVLHDRMGGPDVTVTGGVITVSLGAQSAAFHAWGRSRRQAASMNTNAHRAR
jgi:hypothetical protein